ncbi:MAG: hypothetical protein V4819_19110 [Verrucomicrobiota bacterium]
MGATQRTTKSGEKNALGWAEQKARELDGASGRQWVHAGEGEALENLRRIAGSEEGAIRRLLDDVRDARKWLDGHADLTTAARWYAEHGPLKVERTTAAAAIARFLAEYKHAPDATRKTFTQELTAWLAVDGNESRMLLDIDEEHLKAWTSRKVGEERPAPRTHRNRITTWVTFFNRARDWKLLPESGKHAAELLRKPVIPDAGKEIFTVDQGKRLLAAVREKEPKLETYLLIAGWLGLRPSEIQRLRWQEEGGLKDGGFEWDRGYLHVSVRVAGKNSSERYIPVDPRLLARLKALFLASPKKATAKCCGFRSREFLSVLARENGICEEWPTDVLRHSFCSYRIAVVKSLEQVATEADNSPAILKSNYRKPLREEDGIAWWDLLG